MLPLRFRGLALCVLLGSALPGCDWIRYAGFGGRPRAPDPHPGGGQLDPPPDDAVYHPSAVDVRPSLIACQHDPPPADTARIRVDVLLTVLATGHPADIVVTSVRGGVEDGDEAEPYRQAALVVAETCRYRPGQLRGRPVAVRWSERFEFARHTP